MVINLAAIIKEEQNRKKIYYGIGFDNAVKQMKAHVESGGSLFDKDLCNEDVLSSILAEYNREYGMYSLEEDFTIALNPRRETELLLQDRESGIMGIMEWIFLHGYNVSDVIEMYELDKDGCGYDMPFVEAACVLHDEKIFEFLMEKGFKEMLSMPIDKEDSEERQSFIEWISDDVDLQIGDIIAQERISSDIDMSPCYRNEAGLIKTLISYGGKKRGDYFSLDSNLNISFNDLRAQWKYTYPYYPRLYCPLLKAQTDTGDCYCMAMACEGLAPKSEIPLEKVSKEQIDLCMKCEKHPA